GMRERGDGLGLALEAGERVGVRGQLRGEDLDRDLPVELRVARPVDLAHPARAERREDLVGTETGAGAESHEIGRILFRARLVEGRLRGPDSYLSLSAT